VTGGFRCAEELRDERTRIRSEHPVALESERLHERRDRGRARSAPQPGSVGAPLIRSPEATRRRRGRVGWITAMVRRRASGPMTRWNSSPWRPSVEQHQRRRSRSRIVRPIACSLCTIHRASTCGYWLSALSCARQSNRSCQWRVSSRMVSTSVPNVQPIPGGTAGHRVARRRARRSSSTARRRRCGIHRAISSSIATRAPAPGRRTSHRGRGCCARLVLRATVLDRHDAPSGYVKLPVCMHRNQYMSWCPRLRSRGSTPSRCGELEIEATVLDSQTTCHLAACTARFACHAPDPAGVGDGRTIRVGHVRQAFLRRSEEHQLVGRCPAPDPNVTFEDVHRHSLPEARCVGAFCAMRSNPDVKTSRSCTRRCCATRACARRW